MASMRSRNELTLEKKFEIVSFVEGHPKLLDMRYDGYLDSK